MKSHTICKLKSGKGDKGIHAYLNIQTKNNYQGILKYRERNLNKVITFSKVFVTKVSGWVKNRKVDTEEEKKKKTAFSQQGNE